MYPYMQYPLVHEEMVTDHCIDHLNNLLRGERAAVESYNRAIARCDHIPTELFSNRSSHTERIDLLSRHIWKMGGVPDDSSGMWGSFATTLTDLASYAGDAMTMRILSEGEHKGLHDYQHEIEKVGPTSQAFLRSEILPRQQVSLTAIDRARKDMSHN